MITPEIQVLERLVIGGTEATSAFAWLAAQDPARPKLPGETRKGFSHVSGGAGRESLGRFRRIRRFGGCHSP